MVTRVTNTMLKNTLLSNLSMNLSRMDKMQNQMSSGRKFGHISDDPSALIYGQAARNKLARIDHYQGSISTAKSWLTQAEAGIMELQGVVGGIYEELVSAGSVKTDADKQNLAKVVGQLQNHYVDTLNTAFGDRFVFSGHNTPGDWAANRNPEVKPFTLVTLPNPATGRVEPQLHFNGFNISQFDGWTTESFNAQPGSTAWNSMSQDERDALSTLRNLMGDVMTLEVAPGVEMPVSVNGIDMVFHTVRGEGGPFIRNTFDVLQDVFMGINGHPEQFVDLSADPPITTALPAIAPLSNDELSQLIRLVQDSQNHLLTRAAEIGGRQRRLELLEARFETDTLNYERMRSDAEDADMAEVIMNLKMSETVYQAALSAGARVIQPTLMDFLR